MKNYRLLSLMAIVVLALAGGAASLVVADNPTVTSSTEVVAATAVNSTQAEACPQKCADGPCQPCTPEECAARCGVDLKTAQECQKSAKCQTGAECGSMSGCKMAAATTGECGQGTGCATRAQ